MRTIITIYPRKKSEMETFDRKKVILGLSGGVDSTAAALLLRKKGFQVTGLYFDVEKDGNREGKAAAKMCIRDSLRENP